MAAPVYGSGAVTTGATTASYAVTLPTGVVAGDVILVTLYKENAAAVTPPAGYTQKSQTATVTVVQQQTLFWHRATGSESGTVTFSWTGAIYAVAATSRFSGCVASGDPFDAINANFNDTKTTTTAAVSLTGTSSDTLLHWSTTNFAGGVTFTPPAGFTARDGSDTIGTATKDNTAGGATGSLTGTASVSDRSTAILGSLLPAAASGPWVPQIREPLMPTALYRANYY